MTVQSAGSLRGALPNNRPRQPSAEVDAGATNALTHSLPVVENPQASNAAADARLAQLYAKLVLTSQRIPVPPASTLGHWLEALKLAADSPLLKRLAAFVGGSVKTLYINPDKGEVHFEGGARLNRQSPHLADLPGGNDLIDSLMAAVKVLAPYGNFFLPYGYQPDGFGNFTVDSSVIQHFYHEPPTLPLQQTIIRSKELSSVPLFRGHDALPDNEKLLKVLRMIGDAHQLNNVLGAMKAQIDTPAAELDLDAIVVEVAPHSALWSAQQKQPVTLSLKQLIIGHGLQVPITLDALANVHRALSVAPLRAPSEGDYGGLLSKDVPLGEADQHKISEVASDWKAPQTQVSLDGQGRAPSLIEYLQRAVPASVRARAGEDIEAFLKALISTPQARALGKQLQEAIGALPTQTSAQESLLAALGLDADPAAGQQRNNLAGYNLRQKDNWGLSPAHIKQRFEQHLERRFGPQLAKVVAYQLLALSAPEFLVKDLPAALVYGSQQWASFSAAVMRRELDTPGASAGQAYAGIMQRDALEPITEVGQAQLQAAAMRSVVDWGIANEVIEQSSEDAYAAETIDRAVIALQKQVDNLVEGANAADAPMPNRRELALAELRRVYGVKMESFFEDKTLLGDLPPGSRKRGTYSLLDIYMSGDLYKHAWTSSNEQLTTADIQAGFSKLADIKTAFDKQFDAYADGVKQFVETSFKYQLSLLPVEDRLMIERGKVTTFHLGSPSSHPGPVRAGHPMFDYIESGTILIRAELGAKTCHYLYSPSKGKILKDMDPTRPGLWAPGSRLYFSMERPGRPAEQEDTVTILWQALGTAWPKKDKVDFAALSIYPSKSLETPLTEPYPRSEAMVASKRVNELASVVSAFFSRGVDDAKKISSGETTQERDLRRDKAGVAFLRSLIPFYDTFKSFKNGRPLEGSLYLLLDLIGLVVPAFKGGALAVKAGAKGLASTMSFLKGFVTAGVKAANPLLGLYDIGRGVFKLAKLAKRGFKSTSPLFNKLHHARGHSGSFDIPRAGKTDSVAEGIYRPVGATAEALPTQAVQRNGKWYAYDANSMLPYGAPLKGFTPDAGSGFFKQAADEAVKATVDAGFGAGVALAFQLLQPRQPVLSSFQLPSLPQTESEQLDAADRVGRIVDQTWIARAQTLRRAIQEASKDFAEMAGVEVQAADIASENELTDISQHLDQMDADLGALEEQVDEGAQALSVFFKRHMPAPVDLLSSNLVRDRLNAIEKRLAAVNTARSKMKALGGDAA